MNRRWPGGGKGKHHRRGITRRVVTKPARASTLPWQVDDADAWLPTEDELAAAADDQDAADAETIAAHPSGSWPRTWRLSLSGLWRLIDANDLLHERVLACGSDGLAGINATLAGPGVTWLAARAAVVAGLAAPTRSLGPASRPGHGSNCRRDRSSEQAS